MLQNIWTYGSRDGIPVPAPPDGGGREGPGGGDGAGHERHGDGGDQLLVALVKDQGGKANGYATAERVNNGKNWAGRMEIGKQYGFELHIQSQSVFRDVMEKFSSLLDCNIFKVISNTMRLLYCF